jgi:hypothetical protein
MRNFFNTLTYRKMMKKIRKGITEVEKLSNIFMTQFLYRSDKTDIIDRTFK